MAIWCSGGSEMLTLCMLLLSWRYLASQWLLASVGWTSLARRGGSSWWCQRKSCPSRCLSFVGPVFIQNKKIKRETQGGGFQCSGDADTGAWGRAAWVSLEMQLSPLWFTLMTQGCFFFEDLWQYVWFMRRISLSSFFFRYQGLIGLADCHKGI